MANRFGDQKIIKNGRNSKPGPFRNSKGKKTVAFILHCVGTAQYTQERFNSRRCMFIISWSERRYQNLYVNFSVLKNNVERETMRKTQSREGIKNKCERERERATGILNETRSRCYGTRFISSFSSFVFSSFASHSLSLPLTSITIRKHAQHRHTRSRPPIFACVHSWGRSRKSKITNERRMKPNWK